MNLNVAVVFSFIFLIMINNSYINILLSCVTNLIQINVQFTKFTITVHYYLALVISY